MDKKEPQKEQNVQQQEPNVWVCDAVAVTHCDVSDKGVVYTVTWTDFMGLQHSAKVKREDCCECFKDAGQGRLSLQHHDCPSSGYHSTTPHGFPPDARKREESY